MFELIRHDTSYDFFRLRPYAFALSAALIVGGMIALLLRGGPNYGIDFTGGIMLHISVKEEVDIGQMRRVVDGLGLTAGGASVQEFGNQPGEYLLRLAAADPTLAGGEADRLRGVLAEAFATSDFRMLRTEVVGPRVGAELRQRGILSVLFATMMMGVYLAFRFDLRFGAGAAAALFHDVFLTISALSIANIEIDLTVVAALLTVVGYSVNDTVVVSDRIRENMSDAGREDLRHLINRSINETLSRTILTGITTLLVCLSLYFFGGGVINAFAFTLIVGLITGTYSSIYIATPIVEMWKGGAPPVPVPARS